MVMRSGVGPISQCVHFTVNVKIAAHFTVRSRRRRSRSILHPKRILFKTFFEGSRLGLAGHSIFDGALRTTPFGKVLPERAQRRHERPRGPCRTMIRPCGQRPRESCLSSYPSQRRCDKRVRSTRCSRASTIHQTTTTSKVDVKSLGLVRPSGQLWPPPRRQASRLLRTMPRRSQAQL